MTRRILIYLAVMAGIVTVSGLLIVIFGNSIEVSCARAGGQAPNCRITKVLLGQVPVSSLDVPGVIDVQPDETCDDGCSYRAVLLTSGGSAVPVNDVYTDYDIVMRQIEAIGGFLDGTAGTFAYVEPVQWWVVVMVLGMDLAGAIFVVVRFLNESAHS